MEQFKRAKIVILPINNNGNGINNISNIILHDSKLWYLDNKQYPIINGQNQHLYIISDDEIKENDYFLADNRISKSSNNGIPNWILCRCTKVKNTWVYCNEIPDEDHNGDWCKKIIATTNTLLNKFTNNDLKILDYHHGHLPQPSPQFINKYIKEYNNGNIVTDVSVEYWNSSFENEYDNSIKVDKNNNITIKKLKDNWNREEVIKLIDLAMRSWIPYARESDKDTWINNWIEQNL